MADLLELTDENFDQEVLQADIPVLVDMWAEWCGPCKMIEPTIEEIAKEYAGRLKVGRLNVDENPRMAARYGIRSIPTLLIFQNGAVKDQIVGAVPKNFITSKLDKVGV